MDTRAALAARFAARDPARARLSKAVAISVGVIISAATSSLVLHALHANTSLLVMAVFLSMQAGVMVKDNSAIARFNTTALMAPVVVFAICIATALSSQRPALITAFILVIGGAMWLRRFGPRAAAIGSLTFMGFFFTLVMQATAKDLPQFCLVAIIAVAAQLLVRTALLCKHPRHEITVLLHEFQVASAAAIHQSMRLEHPVKLRSALARIDEIARAITSWQQSFRTEHVIACDEQSFDADVLEARVNTEETCFTIRSFLKSQHGKQEATVAHACAQLITVLDPRATRPAIEEAAAWAHRALSTAEDDLTPALWERQAALTLLAHLNLRAIDLTKPLASISSHEPQSPATTPAASSTPTSKATAEPSPKAPASIKWVPWRRWPASSRIAVQAMAAALIAAGVGEAISASRWYWAVITVFVIFVGGTTRSGILTKAFRRVIGTAIGIALGVSLILVVGDNTTVLVSACVLAVFGMLYFGPLNYTYTPIFITVMLISLYRMMGILTPTVVELRIEETVAGAAVGVLCAYLILSSSSKPTLVAKVSGYFEALDELLRTVQSALKQTSIDGDLATRLHRLETAQADADTAVSSMSTAFLVGSPRHDIDAVHSMYIATRAASKLTQTVDSMTVSPTRRQQSNENTNAASWHSSTDTISQQVSVVLASSATAHQVLCVPQSRQTLLTARAEERTNVLSALNEIPRPQASPAADAIRALARINWALEQITDRDTSRS